MDRQGNIAQKLLITLFCLALMLDSACSAHKDGNFVIASLPEPVSIDPAYMTGNPEHRIQLALFEGLYSYNPQTLEPVPALAESIQYGVGGRDVQITLRRAQWSNGAPITASQFVQSWLREMDPATGAKYGWFPASIIEGGKAFHAGTAPKEAVVLDAPDERTLHFRTSFACPWLERALAHFSFSVVPMHAIEQFGADWTQTGNIVSNGPYILSNWKHGERMELTRSETYWDRNAVILEKITLLFNKDDEAFYKDFRDGNIDWDTSVPVSHMLDQETPATAKANTGFTSYFYFFNFNNKVLSDLRIRTALVLAADRSQLPAILKGGEVLSAGLTPPLPGYPALVKEDIDLAKAKKILSDAGYPDGRGFPVLTILVNDNDRQISVARELARAWKKNLGVTVAIDNRPWGRYMAALSARDFSIARFGWIGDYFDPDAFLSLFRDDSDYNEGNYHNPVFTQLLDKSKATLDPKERMKLLASAELLLVREDRAILPLYHGTYPNLIDTKIWGGWYENALNLHPPKFWYKK